MKKYLCILTFFCTALFFGQVEYGGGSSVTGGRGYGVYHVTTLNQSGAGSIEAHLSSIGSAGGGNIVYDVSGTTEITSSYLYLNGLSNVTIYGQLSPNGGITYNGKIWINNCTNIKIMFIRSRPDYVSGDGYDCITITGSSNIYIVNGSGAFAGDECVDVNFNSDNITIEKFLVGESNTAMIFGNSDTADCENNSLLSNLSVWTSHRFPGNLNSDGRIDAINNVGFDITQRLSTYAQDGMINEINNYYIYAGNAYGGKVNEIVQDGRTPQIYSAGNVIENVLTDPEADNWPYLHEEFNNGVTVNPAAYRVLTPYTLLGTAYPTRSAADAYTYVIANAGAHSTLNLDGSVNEYRDGPDTAYINAVTTRDFGFNDDNYTASSVYTAFQATISSTPVNTFSGHDTDGDGIYDTWETATYGNLTTVSNTSDNDSDGRTDLEEFGDLVYGDSGGGEPGGGGGTPNDSSGSKKKKKNIVTN